VVTVVIDRPSDASVASCWRPAAIYATVGGLVARRRPDNPSDGLLRRGALVSCGWPAWLRTGRLDGVRPGFASRRGGRAWTQPQRARGPARRLRRSSCTSRRSLRSADGASRWPARSSANPHHLRRSDGSTSSPDQRLGPPEWAAGLRDRRRVRHGFALVVRPPSPASGAHARFRSATTRSANRSASCGDDRGDGDRDTARGRDRLGSAGRTGGGSVHPGHARHMFGSWSDPAATALPSSPMACTTSRGDEEDRRLRRPRCLLRVVLGVLSLLLSPLSLVARMQRVRGGEGSLLGS